MLPDTPPRLRSHLLHGTVRHRRFRPVTYEFEHDVFYVALDLSEIDRVAGRLRLVSRNRRNVLAFRDRDHWVSPSDDLQAAVLAHLRAEGFVAEGWRITLITNMRILGYVFNPASFYLCRDRSGELRTVLIEVHNTHHERHIYTLRPQRQGSGYEASMDKDLYVSPFISMDARYTVRVQDDPSGVRIAIAEDESGQPLLVATLMLRRARLTDRMLIRLLLRMPFVTHKTMAAIHLHALRLWRRGVTFHRHSGLVR